MPRFLKSGQFFGILFTIIFLTSPGSARSQNSAIHAAEYIPRLQKILEENIIKFWYPRCIDNVFGGYLIHLDSSGTLRKNPTKMIVSQARTVWMFSRLARAGYKREAFLKAAEVGYNFLIGEMWDAKNGGFYWEVNRTGSVKLKPKKHLYGQAFALYALSEFYLATKKPEVLEFATRFFNLLEEKSHDKKYGGYREFFNRDWSVPDSTEATYMSGGSGVKLMNTHLHLMEAISTFFRAAKLPLARQRLIELIHIQSNTVVRKNIGACTDKYSWDWTPLLNGNYARVSYGHDIENVWLLMEGCQSVNIQVHPFNDLFETLWNYSLKYGYDKAAGGFYDSGEFNRIADRQAKVWWVQSEALVSALYMFNLTGDEKYFRVFEQTFKLVENDLVDWETGEWHPQINEAGKAGGNKASPWKAGYHNARAMIECLEIFEGWR